jgi:hypothetical protein
MLTFIVALQSPQTSKDWSRVSRLCERTLRSVCAQTCSDFHVFLVCNQRPDTTFSHPAITVIEEDFALPEPNTASRMLDKWLKIRRGLMAARALAPAHIMITDADDCVSRRLAALAAKSPQAPGWSFKKGYIHDEGSRWLFLRRNFDRMCGTSAIVRLEPRDCPQSITLEPADPYFILTHGHGVIDDYFRDRGTPLAPLPFAGAIYITDTGENDSGTAYRNWRGKKMLLRKLTSGRLLTQGMRAEFGLYDLDK